MSSNFQVQKKRLIVIELFKFLLMIIKNLVLKNIEKHYTKILLGKNKNKGKNGKLNI
jgi:hypothetical protein